MKIVLKTFFLTLFCFSPLIYAQATSNYTISFQNSACNQNDPSIAQFIVEYEKLIQSRTAETKDENIFSIDYRLSKLYYDVGLTHVAHAGFQKLIITILESNFSKNIQSHSDVFKTLEASLSCLVKIQFLYPTLLIKVATLNVLPLSFEKSFLKRQFLNLDNFDAIDSIQTINAVAERSPWIPTVISARNLFEAKKYSDSLQYYEKIPLTAKSSFGLEIAWAAYYSNQYSILVDFLREEFKKGIPHPEALYLYALSYLDYCKNTAADSQLENIINEIVSRFKRDQFSTYEWLHGYQQNKLDPLELYLTLKSDPKSKSRIPERFLSEFSSDPKTLAILKEFSLIEEEKEIIRKISEKKTLERSLQWTLAHLNREIPKSIQYLRLEFNKLFKLEAKRMLLEISENFKNIQVIQAEATHLSAMQNLKQNTTKQESHSYCNEMRHLLPPLLKEKSE